MAPLVESFKIQYLQFLAYTKTPQYKANLQQLLDQEKVSRTWCCQAQLPSPAGPDGPRATAGRALLPRLRRPHLGTVCPAASVAELGLGAVWRGRPRARCGHPGFPEGGKRQAL